MNRQLSFLRRPAFVAALLSIWTAAVPGRCDLFEMINGDTYEGTVSVINKEGLVVDLDIGGFSERLELVFLNQATLNRLYAYPEYRHFVKPYLDLPDPPIRPPEIRINPVERLERFDPEDSFFSALGTPIGLFFLFLFLGGNLFVSYEVARYRQHSPALVCGISILMPVVTPLLFFFMKPPPPLYEEEEYPEEAEEEAAQAAPASIAQPGISNRKPSMLGLKKSSGGSQAKAASTVFTREDSQFNRTFFEKHFAPFFLVIPPPQIKDMVMAFKGPKGELVAKRITRISGNEIHFQLISGQKEMGMRYGEILQVRLKHKDEQ